ncbi:MAG TPA: efflux RND transporter periplasmic adaptor subunit [Polyangia bacterium]|nr:efflux RND transporter periplasmic adaptor subunit [Polyangia bacterium]
MSAGQDEGRAPAGLRAMSIVRWALVIAMGLVAVLSIAYVAGGRSRSSTHAEHAALYYCPMHPSVVQDHPGECPICSMTLVPRAEGGAATTSATTSVPGLADVELTPERVQLIGMRTARVERAALGGSLRAVGVVAANERGLAQISVRFSGWIQDLKVAETGQRVRRGEILADVYSPDVLRAEQEYLTAKGWEGGVGTDARRRLELLGIAAPEIDAIATSGKAADVVPLRSPVDGFVTTRNVVPGAAIQPGMPLFEVADLSKVWVVADVFEQDAARVTIGQRATLELAAYPGETFTGKVQLISPTLNASTHTLRVRLELPNERGPGGVKLRPGMYGDVALQLPSATGLVIPAEALVDTGARQYVFVAKDGGRFEPRLVQVGARIADEIQIAAGVAEGETVVTTGNFLVDSESRLRAAIDGEK